jgi:hypothetical protein
VPLRVYVDVHMVPDDARQLMHIRIWYEGTMVHSLSLPLDGFRVCFCQLKTGPLDHRKQGHSGHLSQTVIIENRAI